MDELAGLTGEARKRALDRFHLLQPHLENDRPLKAVAAAAGIPFRTAQRWVSLYRQLGLAALARRKRTDTGELTMGTECYDRPPPRTLLIPWRAALVLPGVGEIQHAHQTKEADPQQPAGSDESKDINGVQRLYTRLAQIIQEHHRSQQRQH